MYKQDLRQYSDNELSLLVFNDEDLYKLAMRNPNRLLDVINDLFMYTEEQLNELKNDLNEEQKGN